MRGVLGVRRIGWDGMSRIRKRIYYLEASKTLMSFSTNKEEFKKVRHEDKLRNWKGKNMYHQYLRDITDTTSFVGTWNWLRS